MGILQVNVDKIGLSSSSPADEDYRKVGEELFKAFETIGFVYIRDHGVSKEVIAQSMKTSKEFFSLSLEEKRQIKRDPNVKQGFIEAGQELFDTKVVSTIDRYI